MMYNDEMIRKHSIERNSQEFIAKVQEQETTEVDRNWLEYCYAIS